jgi:hypothetical protein
MCSLSIVQNPACMDRKGSWCTTRADHQLVLKIGRSDRYPIFTVGVTQAVMRGCESLGKICNTVFSQRVVFENFDAGCARGRGRGYLSLWAMETYCESGALGGAAGREKRARS